MRVLCVWFKRIAIFTLVIMLLKMCVSVASNLPLSANRISPQAQEASRLMYSGKCGERGNFTQSFDSIKIESPFKKYLPVHSYPFKRTDGVREVEVFQAADHAGAVIQLYTPPLPLKVVESAFQQTTEKEHQVYFKASELEDTKTYWSVKLVSLIDDQLRFRQAVTSPTQTLVFYAETKEGCDVNDLKKTDFKWTKRSDLHITR